MLVGMDELVFSVSQESDGGYVAECLQEPIFTQGDTWEELCDAVRDAVSGWHFDRPMPVRIRLHLVRDELLAVA
jgi:predicted RNase H-like HicB family nuclease